MNNSDRIEIATIVSKNAAIEVGIYALEARDHCVVFAEIAKILHPFMIDMARRADALEDKAKVTGRLFSLQEVCDAAGFTEDRILFNQKNLTLHYVGDEVFFQFIALERWLGSDRAAELFAVQSPDAGGAERKGE